MIYPGSCHCGAVKLEYETTTTPETSSVRECQCTYCRAQGAHNVSDPGGRLTIRARDERTLNRYVFGLRTAEFLVCARCGIYVAAVLREGDHAWGTVNINALDARDRFPRGAEPVDYDAEDTAGRVARRKARWTPTVIDIDAG